ASRARACRTRRDGRSRRADGARSRSLRPCRVPWVHPTTSAGTRIDLGGGPCPPSETSPQESIAPAKPALEPRHVMYRCHSDATLRRQQEPEFPQGLRITPPVAPHLHLEVQVRLDAEEALEIRASQRADPLQHRTPL